MANKKELTESLFDRFSKRLVADAGILPSPIALIAALFYFQDKKHPLGFFLCSRSKLMRHVHIRSTATYRKRLKDLIQ